MKEIQIKAVIKDDGELTYSIGKIGFKITSGDRCHIVGILDKIKSDVLKSIESNNVYHQDGAKTNVDDR